MHTSNIWTRTNVSLVAIPELWIESPQPVPVRSRKLWGICRCRDSHDSRKFKSWVGYFEQLLWVTAIIQKHSWCAIALVSETGMPGREWKLEEWWRESEQNAMLGPASGNPFSRTIKPAMLIRDGRRRSSGERAVLGRESNPREWQLKTNAWLRSAVKAVAASWQP